MSSSQWYSTVLTSWGITIIVVNSLNNITINSNHHHNINIDIDIIISISINMWIIIITSIFIRNSAIILLIMIGIIIIIINNNNNNELRLTRNVEVVGSRTIKGPCWFLEQETLPLLLSTGWFQDRIWAWIHNRTKTRALWKIDLNAK